MLKSDLAAVLVAKRGMTEVQAEAAVEAILSSMKDALCAGERIDLRGLGAFTVRHYAAYEGHNPRTGTKVTVQAKRAIRFRTSTVMFHRMNARPAK